MSRLALWTTYYRPNSDERESEFIRCLQINSDNPNIHVFYVLCENAPCPVRSDKIVEIPLYERPSFNTFFNLYMTHEPTSVNILINTDIVLDYRRTPYFNVITDKTVFMVTRYEVLNPGDIHSMKDIESARVDLWPGENPHTGSQYYSSYDLWAIRGVPVALIFPEKLGVPKCDGRVAYNYRSLGYTLYNPCLTIFIYHLHSSSDRPNVGICEGKTVELRPTNIGAIHNSEIKQDSIVIPKTTLKPIGFGRFSLSKPN